MSYKATTNFSFDGKNYVEGQDIAIDDEVVLAKLKERGQISSGKGKSADDVQAEADAKAKADSEAADKKRADEAAAREKEYLDRQGKPKVNAKMGDTKEKNDKAGPNDKK